MESESDTTEETEKYGYLWSLIFTIFFGPLGLLYTSIVACVLMVFAIYFDFSKMYFFVQQEPHVFAKLVNTSQYKSALGGVLFFWIACTPIGLIIVFLKNRKIAENSNTLNDEMK